MNIQGQGTQADPYQITTVEQLIWAGQRVNCFAKLMNNLDFNNSDYFNITSAIYWEFGEFDGQGYTISNILFKDVADECIYIKHKYHDIELDTDVMLSSNVTKNTIFEIVVINTSRSTCRAFSKKYDSSGYDNTNFVNCDFRISYYCAYPSTAPLMFHTDIYSNNGKMNFSYCVFNLFAQLSAQINPNSSILLTKACDYSSCEFNVTLVNTAYSYTVKLADGGTMYNGAMFFHLNGPLQGINMQIFNNVTVNNSYFVADSGVSANTNNTVDVQGTINSILFYDADVASNNNINVSTNGSANIKALTTSECKNATHLNSIGFIIAV